jgi:hypothetical protein
VTSPQFEYNTLRPCTEASSPASGVAETHRFGTADISNCACGRYLRTQALNPARQSIKNAFPKRYVDFTSTPNVSCYEAHHVVFRGELFCECKQTLPDSFFCGKSKRCDQVTAEHFFLAEGVGCDCGKYSSKNTVPEKHTIIDRAWLVDFFEKATTRMVDTMKKKNADYGGAVPDPFSNFVQVETLGIATAEQGFLTRMTDKLCRVASFASKGELQVKDESVSDTLLDLANYSLLMMAYLESKRVK